MPGHRVTPSWPRPATCRKLRLGKPGAVTRQPLSACDSDTIEWALARNKETLL